MPVLHPRQSDIVERARREGRVEVDDLARAFNVSPQTIRKDLNDLCARKLLQRIHGGAVFPSTVSNIGIIARGYEHFIDKLESLGADFVYEG